MAPESVNGVAELQIVDAIKRNDLAAFMQHVDMSGVDPCWRDKDGDTLPHFCVLHDRPAMLALLLHKCDITVRNNSGKTALNNALEMQHHDCAHLLANALLNSYQKAKEQKAYTELIEKNPQRHYATFNLAHRRDLPSSLERDMPRYRFVRETLLTHLLENTQNYRTIYHIFLALFILIFCQTFFTQFVRTGALLDLSLLMWLFGDTAVTIVLEVAMLVFSCSCILTHRMLRNRTLPAKVIHTIHISSIVLLLVVPCTVLWVRNTPIGSSFLIGCEQARIGMKMHAYYVTNRRLMQLKSGEIKAVDIGSVNDGKPEPFSEEADVAVYPTNLSFDNYLYFLFCPALVYQTKYPTVHTPYRLLVAFKYFCEFLLCILFAFALFEVHCIPVFKTGCVHDSFQEVVLATFQLMVPLTTVYMMGFYGLLHCWMNCHAVLLSFGDKCFYDDWWSSHSYLVYYRKWNIIVHNWLHRYIFLECMHSLKLSRQLCILATFLLSALIHELIVMVSLKFLFPVLGFLFLIPGVVLPLFFDAVFKGRQGNVLFWTMLIIGHGILGSMYSRIWYHLQLGVPVSDFVVLIR